MKSMETYSVKQIADMLNTQPETVRRWIRSGKLYAEKSSRKEGHVVTEESLNKFLKKTPKYAGVVAGIAGAAVLSPVAAIPAAGGILAAYLSSNKGKKTDESYSKEDVKRYLNEEIERRNVANNQKLNAIEQLQKEIAADQQQIAECKLVIGQIEQED